ncbi:MAG TPA: NAD(P) transhydrogenase subunit alpha [Kiritimatiellia bacterium]|nr:NAD(P) transhydrogenase subunit alpha [Kiritimatiellia bacterium]
MRFFVPIDARLGEPRVAITPATAKKLIDLGAEVEIQAGLAQQMHLPDADYVKAGCLVSPDRNGSLAKADVVLVLNSLGSEDIRLMRKGAILAGFLDPFSPHDLMESMAHAGISALSMEMIPRTTLAQKMDALSSQASLSGYVAVVLAANKLTKVFPMMMTPAGTLAPARVFVIGVGVAGLQAIATARRLGALVEAFDTRPVEDQVKSLGARFVKVDLGETGQTKDGYARALTPEQLAKQREAMARHCAGSDVVIAAAQVFGKKAPVIVTDVMLRGMKPGSVVVDTSIDTGGNVEGAEPDKEIVKYGVHVLAYRHLASRVPEHASQMYSNNLLALVEHTWNREAKQVVLNREDEIVRSCLLTHEGKIVHERFQAPPPGGPK